ncbi:unnamed protein product [Mytilus coruscus]|uniref:Myb/SANT-like DNA-binding domain-containing protein n=1 Tax=Mytilus coruscus TaxID=42192 RepID=A0A6J8EFN6_MYTCO|nr:unnamed protein product [Mytilus coruscus]
MTMLQQLVNDNITVLRSKLTNSITNSKKNGIWKDISSKINAIGLHSRSDKEVKTKWQNFQTKAKKEYAESMKYRAQTGGGPAPKALTSETENIVEMMKDCSSFVGLKGSESSIVIINPEDLSNSGIEDSIQSTIIAEAIVHRADNSGNESVLFFEEQPPFECRTGKDISSATTCMQYTTRSQEKKNGDCYTTNAHAKAVCRFDCARREICS